MWFFFFIQIHASVTQGVLGLHVPQIRTYALTFIGIGTRFTTKTLRLRVLLLLLLLILLPPPLQTFSSVQNYSLVSHAIHL